MPVVARASIFKEQMKRFPLLLAVLLFALPVTARSQTHSRIVWKGETSDSPKMFVSWPKLKRGARGETVRTLQSLLSCRGFEIPANGIFGPATEQAVRAFQTRNRFKPSGVVGWQTWELLPPNLKRGSRGAAVVLLQRLLAQRGFRVARNGVFGATTENAVRSFQKKSGFGESEIGGWEINGRGDI